MSSIVFDATALIHFSRAGRLRELQTSTTEDEAILLANVAKELEQGGPLRPILDPAAAAWLKPADLTEITELAAFARYRTELGGRAERNNGEAAVLAWISINGGTAIIDEEVAISLRCGNATWPLASENLADAIQRELAQQSGNAPAVAN